MLSSNDQNKELYFRSIIRKDVFLISAPRVRMHTHNVQPLVSFVSFPEIKMIYITQRHELSTSRNDETMWVLDLSVRKMMMFDDLTLTNLVQSYRENHTRKLVGPYWNE